jgi:protein-disulfide isomerase
MKNPWVIVGLIAVVLIGGSVWYSNEVAKKNNEGVVVSDHVKGNPQAAVTLVEYSDFQCPACASFQPVLTEILAAYGDSIRFEYKHFPLVQIHARAEAAARAAESAGQQGKFFEYHDQLFANQSEWVNSANPYSYFTQYAEDLGLDMDQFKRQSRSSLLADKVRAQYNEARELGLTGTPSFYLNGERMSFKTFEEFNAQIEAAVTPSVDFTVPVTGTVGQ